MSLVEGGRKLEDFGEKPVKEDLSGLFGEGEVVKSNLTQSEADEFMTEVAAEQKMRQLTPEIVSSAWDRLNHYEKRFVTAPQDQFDKLIDGYEASHSAKRRHLITGLRKLIEARDPLAAEINPEDYKQEEIHEKKAA